MPEESPEQRAAAKAAPLLVSLSSYGSAEVRRHGQRWFTQLVADAGADGVEVRGELLVEGSAEIDAIATTARQRGLTCVFSSPEGLWDAEGRLDLAALDRALESTASLGASRLKMSIGGYRSPGSEAGMAMLQQRLARSSIELLIENDQTEAAGSLGAMQAFFAAADQAGVPLAMTFDLGNWHWQGECPLQAAQALAVRVTYVHCKGVQREARRWVAVPLADSAAPWRAALRSLPRALPWAIEYPLVGDDLLAVTRAELARLRQVAQSLS